MKILKKLLVVFLMVFLLFSLIKNILGYRSKFVFYENTKKSYEIENKKNIELKTEIVKKKSQKEVEKTIRNKLNLLKENEVAIIIEKPELLESPTPTPNPPNWKQWLDLFVN